MAFHRRMIEGLNGLPSVSGSAAATRLPLSNRKARFEQTAERHAGLSRFAAAILAHGCNLGLYTMEKVAPDIAPRRGSGRPERSPALRARHRALQTYRSERRGT